LDTSLSIKNVRGTRPVEQADCWRLKTWLIGESVDR
jgi:hypothetical protein